MNDMTRHNVKKGIVFSCWLIVGAIILAHAVVPHHHHEGMPCISYTHHDSSGQHPCDAHEDCLLTKIYLKWNNEKQTHQFHQFDFTPFPCQIILFTNDFTCRIQENIGLLSEQKPYILPFYTLFIAHSSGLRAPPVC